MSKKQKYVLVTASSKGLGFEIAKQLSFNGYNIILTSRSNKNLKKAKKQLNQDIKHKTIQIDFTKDDLEQKLFKKIKKLPIVAIVHNFGLNLPNDTHPINIDILEQSIYTNFIVSLKINNFLYEKLQGDSSKIIYIGSTASLHTKASPSYILSKSLINTYVKNISQTFLNNNILICAVLPGILAHKDSEWDNKKKLQSQKYKDTKEKQPLKRFAIPQDIAPYVVDIIQQKSMMITGSIIKLDANEY